MILIKYVDCKLFYAIDAPRHASLIRSKKLWDMRDYIFFNFSFHPFLPYELVNLVLIFSLLS